MAKEIERFLNKTRIYKYRVTYEVFKIVRFPKFHGTTLRGIFGSALRKVSTKIYLSVFETLPPPDVFDAKKYTSAPRPFVIQSSIERQLVYYPGDKYYFDIVLVGNANDKLHDIIRALFEVSDLGIGDQKGYMRFLSLENFVNEDKRQILTNSSDTIPLTFDTDFSKIGLVNLDINFMSPIEIKKKKIPKDISFQTFVSLLWQRIERLGVYYCGEKEPRGAKTFLERAASVKMESSQIFEFTIKHYSGKSEIYKWYDSQLGSITYRGYVAPYLQLIQMGQHLHLGRGTTAGMGQYQMKIRED